MLDRLAGYRLSLVLTLITFASAASVASASGGDQEQAPAENKASSTQATTKAPELDFRLDTSLLSKYVWRGQNLTNDWSLQPSMTVGSGPFSVNVWGTLDLAAVNEGPGLPLASNPNAGPGNHSGLQGKFSEIDYTFTLSQELGKGTLTGGAIIYTFPERSAVLSATTEVYAGYAFSSLPLSPSATLFLDVDESREKGASSLYLRLSAARSVRVDHRVLASIDFSGWVSFVNEGFGNYYYGTPDAGIHDLNLTVSAPLKISERWSASAFLGYSALLGSYREVQYPDLRDVYRGRTGPGKADTVWGGMTVSLAF